MAFRKHIDYDLELEAKVIGILLIEPLTYSEVSGVLNEECFYAKKHLEIYNKIKLVYEKGYTIDCLIVQRMFFDAGITEIEGEKIPYIFSQCMDGVYSSSNVAIWCIMLRELGAKRLMTLLKTSGRADGDVFEEASKIETKLRRILDVRVTDDWVHMTEVMIKLANHMDSVKGNKRPGVSTSIAALDEANGGFRPGQLIVFAARPGVGKSAFMGRIAVMAAREKVPVGIISLEMEDKDILARSVSAESDVPFWRIDRNDFGYKDESEQQEKVRNIMNTMSSLPIYYSDTSNVNINDIRMKAEKLKSRNQLGLLIIDYLQLIEGDGFLGKNIIREQEIARMSRGLKLLAMNLQIPVIILAQLNRESEKATDKKPQLHNLRESGAIEQDADIVIFLHRDWKSGIKLNSDGNSTEMEADILTRKWRNGKEVDVKMGFDGEKMKFYDLPDSAVYPTPQNTTQNNQQYQKTTKGNDLKSVEALPF